MSLYSLIKRDREIAMTALNDGLPANGFATLSAQSAAALAESMDESGVGALHNIVPT
jgi:hypothetical protein